MANVDHEVGDDRKAHTDEQPSVVTWLVDEA